MGTIEETLRAHIRAVLQTRKFVDVDSGGERVMRPEAFSLVPFALFEPFIPEMQIPLLETWIVEALSWLERERRLRIVNLQVKAAYNPERLIINLQYQPLGQETVLPFTTEIRSMGFTEGELSGRY